MPLAPIKTRLQALLDARRPNPAMAAGWTVFRQSPDGIDYASIARPLQGRPTVNACGTAHLDIDDPRALAKWAKSLPLDRYPCCLLLNANEYQLLQIDTPPVPRNELRAATRWRIKDLLDHPVDETTFDVLASLSPDAAKGPGSVFVLAAHNTLIQKYMDLFRAANLPLLAIDTPETALWLLSGQVDLGKRAAAILTFTEDAGILMLALNGELIILRRIDLPLITLVDTDKSKLRGSLERIALELHRSLDRFEDQFSPMTVSKLMVLAPPWLAGLQEYLAINLPIPVESIKLQNLFDLSAVPALSSRDTQSHYLTLLAAALRQVA